MRKILAMTFLTVAFLSSLRAADEGVAIFNGKDTTGWKLAFRDAKDASTDPKDAVSIQEGALVIKGKPTFNVYTEKSYKNYVLTFEWRFPKGSEPKSNSGCLIHMQDGKDFKTKSIESQGRYLDHGKIYFMNGQKGEAKFDQAALDKVLKPMGEWSKTEVTAGADGSFSVKVNGAAVSSGKSELKEGQIGFQSEGWEVHYRNIKIVEKK